MMIRKIPSRVVGMENEATKYEKKHEDLPYYKINKVSIFSHNTLFTAHQYMFMVTVLNTHVRLR